MSDQPALDALAGTRPRLEQAVGSLAGSGSGAFHVYREHRRTEMDRIALIEREAEQAARKEEFQKRLEANKLQDQARLEKNQRRRKRRKQIKSGTATAAGSDDDGSTTNEKEKKNE